jgi:hypothetical protein
MSKKTKRVKFLMCLPVADKSWLRELAEFNSTSMAAEIIRSVHERRERLEGEEAA